MTTLNPSFQKVLSDDPIDRCCRVALEDFKQITRQYALFHITFFAIGCMELAAFVLFFSFLTQSTIFAFSLATLFLSVFTYFVLLFYFQAKKPQQLFEVRKRFMRECQAHFSYAEGSTESHLARTAALEHLLVALHRQEYTYYTLPPSFQTLSPLMQKFSVWTHWKDLHQMKELLLLMIVKEQIEVIKLYPIDLGAHARLAATYTALTHLYMDPRKRSPDEEHIWVSYDYTAPAMIEKFKRSALRAIEELKILDIYAPQDPWVHEQLAMLYHHLELPLEEIRAYEILLKAAPHHSTALFRLGVLYFEQGMNAQALRLYEQLKKNHPSQAEELIAHYGAAHDELALL